MSNQEGGNPVNYSASELESMHRTSDSQMNTSSQLTPSGQRRALILSERESKRLSVIDGGSPRQSRPPLLSPNA